jgi:two-component system, LuxR family, response regulator FixJ
VNEPEATVIVVDDDASVRRGLERLLRAVGYRAETYGSAEDFLARLPIIGPDARPRRPRPLRHADEAR